ncbi:hypothetical protein GIX45_28425 [Erwinia sp. CPCC 100877]|nr:hypothetical protein [Erwinia sp. CPCC 100877]
MNKPKFRAWDDRNGKMVTNFNDRDRTESPKGFYRYRLDVVNGNEIQARMYFAIKEEMIYRPYMDLPTMQYTGLKDKNGVEIYEGDILVYDAPKKYAHRRSMHEIAYADGRFFWEFLDLVFCQSNILYRDGYLVIGNIHENPELLSGVE